MAELTAKELSILYYWEHLSLYKKIGTTIILVGTPLIIIYRIRAKQRRL